MQLTFRDIEKAFEIEEQVLYQWLNSRGMPSVKANGQYYFNSVEVLEWALKNKVPLTGGVLKLCEKNFSKSNIFIQALTRGGAHFGILGAQREEVLIKALDFLPLPAHILRPPLEEILLSRQQSGTTGIGNGIAIPHIKHPIILAGVEPLVGLFFLENPVDFSAFDGKPVHTLFMILTGSFKTHLSLLSQLAFCLQSEAVRLAIENRLSFEEILAAFQAAEVTIKGAS